MQRIYEAVEQIARENILKRFQDPKTSNYMFHTKLCDGIHIIYISHDRGELIVYTGCYLRYVPTRLVDVSVLTPEGENLGDVIYFDEPIISIL